MPIILFYFIRRVGGTVALLWLGLTALVAALEMLADLGEQNIAIAIWLAILQTPRLAMETLPFACAIGAAVSLQRMEENRELQAMRAAGLSLAKVALLAGGGGAIFSLAAIGIGELLLSPAGDLSRAIKNTPAQNNVWLHSDGVFFHAKQLSPEGEMQHVSVYEITANTLHIITAAAAAQKDGNWQFTDGEESHLSENSVRRDSFVVREWGFSLPAAAIKSLIRHPRDMSFSMLSAAGIGGVRYTSALWRRIVAIFALPLLAACAIFSIGGLHRRTAAAVLIATALVGVYYFSVIIFSQFALLFRLPALALAPLLLLASFLFFGVRK